MMIIRPINDQDYDALWQIAQITGIGFSSLQPDPDLVRKKLNWALDSLQDGRTLEEALYLFVLEDTNSGQVIGVSGIESAVGLSSPWYNYKVSTQVHACDELNAYTKVKTLTLCSDHTGCSELCTLFLTPEYRHSCNGHLLSKARLMFMAAHTQRFSEEVIAELRGYSDENGESPFWEALGRHFFAIDFVEADRQVARGKAFIAELMPRHPIYANLLPEQAQKIIGQTHQDTVPARKLLEAEGFNYNSYVDIFDAGPLIEARIGDLRAIRESKHYKVKVSDRLPDDEDLWLIANDRLKEFRCLLSPAIFEDSETISITSEQANALQVGSGDTLRAVTLSDRSK
ncbi:MAG: arginine N-succinyltransferase [Endozoicomonas sp.]